ncbi:MAG: bifunctional [glutamate--ammonia ligase]-adenylyl-L-tyrosine phosphorylase/[glutamate--ammonia-ligase] adenylyltransferase [Myxococcota bacterium]
MPSSSARWFRLAERIDPGRAATFTERLGPHASAAAILLATAYPGLAPEIERDPSAAGDPRPFGPETRDAFLALPRGPDFPAALRRLTRRVRHRIALRELLPPDLGGAPIEITARELSRLADVTISVALREAEAEVRDRLGPLLHADGARSRIVVLGMGKLGGSELNCGSDVDLVAIYDADGPEAVGPSGRVTTAHRYWTKVVQRMTEHLSAVTEEGFVWRVDHRLRPEGAQGPLVNALGPFERYYEAFGRLWERAAMLRARPVAGDAALGESVLETLRPFVWRRRVDPSIAAPLVDLVRRQQTSETEPDLKVGAGGIREAEFFVQVLQLVWGGLDERLRPRRTILAADRLHGAGLMSDREWQTLIDAYLDLRRAEHAIQWSTGVQTHRLPEAPTDRERLARALGFDDAKTWIARLEHHRAQVRGLLAGLLPDDAEPNRWRAALTALDGKKLAAFESALEEAGMPDLGRSQQQLVRDLFETSRVPDGPLGTEVARERQLAAGLLDAVADAADPTLAARHLRGFVSRVRPAGVYTRLLRDDPIAVQRLVTALGGSAFVGEAVARQPELADLVLFDRSVPRPDEAYAEVLDALARIPPGADPEAQAAPVRRAKLRMEVRVALADLAGEIDTPQATRVLSAVADGALEVATRLATPKGLAVVAMGKLGGREIGYGSDLDVIFVYDPDVLPGRRAQRAARRIIQNLTATHPEGAGYELDTRLRPSGNQGMLVVSRDAFARYHAVVDTEHDGPAHSRRAAHWERLALTRARFVAGDAAIGEATAAVVTNAVYGRGDSLVPLRRELHRLRTKMGVELSREARGRYDLKFGRGGLIDVTFTVQVLQLRHGPDIPELRTTSTPEAIEEIRARGLLPSEAALALRDGYAFLRRLEQRIRIVYANADHLIDEDAPGLRALARRMGIRDEAGHSAGAMLVRRYRALTRQVRDVYEQVVAGAEQDADPALP